MFSKCVSFGILIVACSAAVQAQPDYVASEALRQAGLVKFWQLKLPLHADQRVRDCYLVDDQLYVTTNDGVAYAVDAHSGALRWVRQVTRGGYRLTAPCHTADRAIFGTPAQITQYSRRYGDPIIQTDLRFPAGSAPATDGVRFFVGGINQRLYAFPLNLDFEVWKTGLWGRVIPRPVLFGPNLFFASDSGDVYAANAADKELVWRHRLGGTISADLVIDENGLYIASENRSLYLLNRNVGGMRWRARLSSPLREAPVVTPEVAYQFSELDGLVAINTATDPGVERIRWKNAYARAMLTRTDRFVYLLSRDQQILVANEKTGDVSQNIPVAGLSIHASDPGGSSIYLAGSDGRVFCARPTGTPLPTAADVQAALFRKKPSRAVATSAPADGDAGERAARTSSPRMPPIGGTSEVTKRVTGGSGDPP